MPHRKLGRNAAHRVSMLKTMVSQLVKHERIETTITKAKEVRRVADNMVQLGKEGTLDASRRAAAFVRGDDVLHKLFTELAYRYKDRAGGYTRILRTRIRVGDAAPMAYIENSESDVLWSAEDRTKTILTLSSPDSKPGDLRRPGHVFPLKYRNGGVLKRAGHTEASVDLVALAGLQPVSVLSTIVDPIDGSMAGLPALKQMAVEYNMPIVSIADLIRYRRKREKLVELVAIARLPTKWGLFNVHCYKSKLDGTEHVAVVKGDIGDGQDVLVRVHSECLTGDILGSARCDCGNQLDQAMQLIEKAGRGVVVYLRGHEGRGIGLGQKLRAYNLQDQGSDTVEANVELGLAIDSREYGIGAQILRDIGVRTMRLMTNNPAKFVGLKGYGLAVIGRVPVISPITAENQKYLETKRTKMGHVYGSDLPGNLPEFSDFDLDVETDQSKDQQ